MSVEYLTNLFHRICFIVTTKQNRSTEGCSKLKRSVDMTSVGMNGLNIRTKASSKWDIDVRLSKLPLLASRTSCKCSIETSRNEVIT